MKRFIFLFLSLPLFLQGLYLEHDSIMTVLHYVAEDTIVISDIDNTLIESEQHLGSSQWADYLAIQFFQSGKADQDVDQLIVNFGCRIHPFIKMRCVDSETPVLIRQLHEKKIPLFGLTARHPEEADHTHRQLALAQIRMSESDYRMSFTGEQSDMAFDRGILFCTSHHKKSAGLKSFFDKSELRPKKVIFIDDKWKHVRDVGEYVEQLGIEYIGLRFSRADERVEKFSPEIAKLQYDHLPKFLSDEEAAQMVRTR